MSQVLTAVQLASTRILYSLLSEVLTEIEVQVPSIARAKMDIVSSFIDHVNSDFQALESGKSAEPRVESEMVDIEALTLVDDEQLEAQLAVEGMVAYSRNEHLQLYVAFNTRINSLFTGDPINEATNPLDPEQIATSFTAAIKGLGLVGSQSLNVYRAFNKGVLRKLNEVLEEANKVLIEHDVIPDLSVMGINKPAYRSRTTRPREADDTLQFGQQERARRGEDAGAQQAELFSMLRGLLHQFEGAPGGGAAGTGGAGAAPPSTDGLVARATGGKVPQLQTGGEQVMDQSQLLAALTQIQQGMAQLQPAKEDEEARVVVDEERIHKPLAETLHEAQQEGDLKGVDQSSSDVISLVSLLYNVIREDESVPKRINELIDRTQISIAKVALTDNSFFDREDHPGRALLNEFASASVGWTETEDFRRDPLYKKIESSVDRILTEPEPDEELFNELLTDFREFREEEDARERKARPAAPKSAEGDSRAQEAQELVDQTIDERLLGRNLDTFTEELLQGPWHRFMVLIALKQGAGSKAWKHAVTTLDVLLWTLEEHDDVEDRKRLEAINPRLLNNLRKALKIASLSYPVINGLVERIRQLQEESFPALPEAPAVPAEVLEEPLTPDELAGEETGEFEVAEDAEAAIAAALEHPASTVTEFAAEPRAELESPAEPEAPPITAPEAAEPEVVEEVAEAGEAAPSVEVEERYLRQVDELSVGLWVEFLTGATETTRCKLAAKITAIDKLIFVNRQGVKVVETTRDKLAAELQEGTVRVISEGQLFSRALEAVIGELRDAQHEQQTGGAYHAQPA